MADSAAPWCEILAQEERALAQLVDRLTGVRAAISDTEAALHRYRQDKSILQAIITRKRLVCGTQRSLLCPIARLSDETLAAIFGFIDADGEPDEMHLHIPEYLTMRLPCILAGVCRRWRATAIHCPDLWRRIYVDCDTWTVDLLEHALQRSQSSPLTIRLSGYIPGSMHDALFHRLLSHSARWRFISIELLHIGSAHDHILYNFQLSTPLLEGFALFLDYDLPEAEKACSPPGDMIPFLPDAPRLRKLTLESSILHRVDLRSAPLLDTLDLVNDCDQLCPERTFDLLSVAPSLAWLEISRRANVFPLCTHRPMITLPLLTHLSCGASFLLAFMDHLRLPALDNVSLRDYECLPGNERIFQCYSTIRALEVFSPPATCPTSWAPAGHLPLLVSHLPRLENIRLTRFTFDGDDFARLSRPDPITGAWLAQNLCNVRLVQPRFVPGTDARTRLLDFIRSRTEGHDGVQNGCARMRRVVIGGQSARSVWLNNMAANMCRPV